jgi:glycosyltransferase involved in cell wall biosynthesis
VAAGAPLAAAELRADVGDGIMTDHTAACAEAGLALPKARATTARRVLFVHQSCELYGSDRVLLDVASALRRGGGEPIVVLPGGGPLIDALRARRIETHPVAATHVIKLSRQMMTMAGLAQVAASVPAALRAIDHAVDGRPIDVVHSNTLAVLGGALWSRRRRRPHLWHVHEIVEHPPAAAWLFPRVVRALADQVVCNSHATQAWLVGAQPALQERTQVVWNGVSAASEVDAAQPDAALHARFRPHGETLAIGLVGRINRMKGHAVLLDAALRLHEQGVRDFSLVFIGEPPPGQPEHLQALRRCVAASPLAAHVVFAGFIDDAVGAMRAIDILCVPSTEAEAFGLVAVEAMAASRPVLASRSGGLPEVLGDCEAGWLHAPGDAAGLAAQLQRLIEDTALRERMGQAGRARHARCFTQAAMGARMLGLFDTVGAR